MEGLYLCIACNTAILWSCFNRGGWDSTGVTTTSISNNTITCNSSHLTSFAVLVDVAGGHRVCKIEHSTVSLDYFHSGIFGGRTESIVNSIIYWVWNINSLFADRDSCASILQVSTF